MEHPLGSPDSDKFCELLQSEAESWETHLLVNTFPIDFYQLGDNFHVNLKTNHPDTFSRLGMNGQIMEIRFYDQTTYTLNKDAYERTYRVILKPLDLSFTPNYTSQDFLTFMNLLTRGTTTFPSSSLPVFAVFLLNMGLEDILINVTTTMRDIDYNFSKSARFDDLLLMDLMTSQSFGSKVEEHFRFLKLSLEYLQITQSCNQFTNENGDFSPILAHFQKPISFISVKSSLYLKDRIQYFMDLLKYPQLEAPDRDLVMQNTPKFIFQLIEMYIYKGDLTEAKLNQDLDQNPQVHQEMQNLFPILGSLSQEDLDQDTLFTIADTFAGVLPNKLMQQKLFYLQQSLTRQFHSLQSQKATLETVIMIRNKVNSKQF